MTRAVRYYFNPKPVLEAKRKATERVLVRQATYVRTAMKFSIKHAGGKSKAPVGKQPLTHNSLLRNSIQWGLDRGKESAVVGPSFKIAGIIGHTHEFGGVEHDNMIRGGFLKKLMKKKSREWDLTIGGHGPIREMSGGKLIFGRLNTGPQVSRARGLAQKATDRSSARTRSKGRRYPKRPFAGRVLDRQKVQKRLVDFWKDTIGPSGSAQGKGSIGL